MSNTEMAVPGEKSRQLNHMKANRLDDSLFSKELAPHYMQLAGQLSKSLMVPKAYQGKPQDLFIAMAMGYQIGLSVEQAIQAIAVINGKPCLWGDDMLALCIAHPDFVDIIEEPIIQDNAVIGYTCTVKRKNMSEHSKLFTLDMAKKAGLLGKVGPWTQYPERMLQLRARSWALRDKFPDALKGIKSREEIEDYIDADYSVASSDKGSRTQALKNDILIKTGQSNDYAFETPNEIPNLSNSQVTEKNDEPKAVGEPGVPSHSLHDEIKRLVAEKSFSDERMDKALTYYEVNSIDQLSADSGNHFINQLNKE